MTMKIQKLFAVLLVLLGAHSLSAVAQDNEIITEPLIYKPEKELPKVDLSRIRNEDWYSSRARAMGLQHFQIYAIQSSKFGYHWEYPGFSASSTVQDHGGAHLRVVVFQYGYGNSNAASLNAKQKYEYQSDSLCGSLSTIHPCRNGEPVTGYFLYFNFDGEQSGQLSVSANSTAYPFVYKQDSIYIK